MDSELSDSSESVDGRVGGKIAALPLSLTAIFEDACPHYLAMGMTYEQYWDGDVCAHRAYREAKRIRTLERNRDMWLQGMYIYEALLDVAQYNKAFSKSKPRPYRDAPYDLFEAERKEREEREQRERYMRIKAKMEMFAKRLNEKRHESMSKEGVDEDARCISERD